MKLAISERDKFLLCLVGSLLLVFLAYYFGFRNFSDKTSALESEISTLQVKYNDLKDKSDNIPKYKQDTENYNRIFEGGSCRIRFRLFTEGNAYVHNRA